MSPIITVTKQAGTLFFKSGMGVLTVRKTGKNSDSRRFETRPRADGGFKVLNNLIQFYGLFQSTTYQSNRIQQTKVVFFLLVKNLMLFVTTHLGFNQFWKSCCVMS